MLETSDDIGRVLGRGNASEVTVAVVVTVGEMVVDTDVTLGDFGS